jgi:hypothetical protein
LIAVFSSLGFAKQEGTVINQRMALIGAVAFSCVVGIRADAQRGASPAGQEGTPPANAVNEKKVSLEGCVFPKRALSSKEPVTVPAGSVEEYVVTDTHVISASTGLPALEGRVFTAKGVEQEPLRGLIGKRVLVSARVDDKPPMPELQVISMVENVGSCPVVPTPPQ